MFSSPSIWRGVWSDWNFLLTISSLANQYTNRNAFCRTSFLPLPCSSTSLWKIDTWLSISAWKAAACWALFEWFFRESVFRRYVCMRLYALLLFFRFPVLCFVHNKQNIPLSHHLIPPCKSPTTCSYISQMPSYHLSSTGAWNNLVLGWNFFLLPFS